MFLLTNCHSSENRSIVLNNNIREEGNIGKDSILDGLIDFYDNKSNRLLRKSTYLNGIENGPDTLYYENGKISVAGTFADGKQNGYVYEYDKSGNLIAKKFFYYNFRSGNNINFLENSPKTYYFYSLDDDILFYLNYDSIKGKKIRDLQPEFYYFRKSEYESKAEKDYKQKGTELFLYTPNPPQFDFKYSLVLIDSAYNVLSVLKEFDNKEPWSRFDYHGDLAKANTKLAIRLKIEDSINNQKIEMYKKVK